MLKSLFTIGLVLASFLLQGCNRVTSQSSESEIKSATPQPQKEISKQQRVEFKGVSFSYNPRVFGEVKSEEIAESPLEDETDKPYYVVPRHISFRLKKAEQNREANIYVFPIEDYRQMYAISSHMTKVFDDELSGLRKVTENKNYRIRNQIPFIPFRDGSQTFQKKVEHFSFQNGEGILFLTQFDIEPSLINNEGLTYCFQAISNDGKNYISATFPVSVTLFTERL